MTIYIVLMYLNEYLTMDVSYLTITDFTAVILMRLQHDYHSCDYKNKFLHFIYMQIFLLSCLLDSSNAESHCMFPPRSIFSTVCIFSFIQAEFACLHSEAVSCREAGL